MTAEDLYDLPHDENKYELASGLLIKMPPAGVRHGGVALRIGSLLDHYTEGKDLGRVYGADTGFILQRNPDIVRAPDAAFVAKARIPTYGEPNGFWDLAPDLAVEVVSPWDRDRQLNQKINEYFAAGTRLVWVVYPDTRTVYVYRSPRDVRALDENGELDGEGVLPGFACPIRRCFP
jgi:Uma2 family endonuclease